jgi:hypothetical protein
MCPIWDKKLDKFFPEARHHQRADQKSKIIAIEPMNRKGFVHSRDKKAQRSERREKQLNPSHVDFGQCARVANFADCLCVQKGSFGNDHPAISAVWSCDSISSSIH